MLELNTILVPTDFSESSRQAFEVACALAHGHGGRVVVLHVIQPGKASAPPPGPDLPPPLEVHEEMEQHLHWLRSEYPDVCLERWLEEGDAPEEILRVARESRASLIVMGSHGRTGLARVLMGSVAEKVVRQAGCLVLTVTSPHRAGGPGARKGSTAAGG